MSTPIDPRALDATAATPEAKEPKPAPQPRMPFGRWVRTLGWRHLVGIAVAIFATFPLIYVLSASFNPTGTLTGSNQLFRALSLDNYVKLLSDPNRPYAAWFGNTMIVGIATSIGTVFLGALAAYSFSRMRFTGRRAGLLSLILVQMFPQLLAVVAIYVLMRGIGEVFPAIGLDSLLGLIMVYLGGALGVNTYLMYGFFNTVPSSIDEAAKLDGAGHARIFFTIILRLVAPILAVIGLLSFIGTTNDFVISSVILTSPEKLTLAVGLFRYVSEETNTNYPVFAAGAVLAAIPVVLLFLYLQKYIVSGLTAGAVK
ncbi:sugar ABC transporter permease [Agrococcus terreus]|uniref:sugar ABC transporter permease n=1 Tax=Agrococcus terreus TaxID=574649 RepID=UPI00384ED6D7